MRHSKKALTQHSVDVGVEDTDVDTDADDAGSGAVDAPMLPKYLMNGIENDGGVGVAWMQPKKDLHLDHLENNRLLDKSSSYYC